MSLRDEIATGIAATVTALAEAGWTWAARTSANDAESFTFGTATAITAHPTGLRVEIQPDDIGETTYELQQVRVPYTGVETVPAVFDKFIDPAGDSWIVTAIISQGPGTRAYEVERAERFTRGPQRGRIR